jgi:hypothetical protein
MPLVVGTSSLSPLADKLSQRTEGGGVMDRETVMVMNWMALMLLVPATIILVWKIVSEKLKGKAFSSDLITVSLVLGSAVIGVTQLNIESNLTWLHWVLLLVQLLVLVFLWKRLWAPLMQKLRG